MNTLILIFTYKVFGLNAMMLTMFLLMIVFLSLYIPKVWENVADIIFRRSEKRVLEKINLLRQIGAVSSSPNAVVARGVMPRDNGVARTFTDCKYVSPDEVDNIANCEDTNVKGDELENLVEWIYTALGYSASRASKLIASGEIKIDSQAFDQGGDVVATSSDGRRVLIQCKAYLPDRNLDGKSIQEVVAARSLYKADAIEVITTAQDFTNPAKELAKVNGCRLVASQGLRELIKQANKAIENRIKRVG